MQERTLENEWTADHTGEACGYLVYRRALEQSAGSEGVKAAIFCENKHCTNHPWWEDS